LQRRFYTACPDPDIFWRSTFAEVLLIIQGFEDRQRIERRNAYNLYCAWVEKPISIFEFSPLSYDDELREETPENNMTDLEIYNLVKSLNNNFDTPITLNGG
jgi:hypothetical protein